jgi:DNA modification methylase
MENIKLTNGDCLIEMEKMDDKSVDLIFCDLPYGQTACSWDHKIDLNKLWVEIMRIKKLNTPIFFTTTTKFGVDLIQSAPKKCYFRYDLVWVKSAPASFLLSKKMPMRKHEMIYVFYEKLPFYDLSSHKHKFVKANIKNEPTNKKEDDLYGIESGNAGRKKGFHQTQYDPPLPVSVVKEEIDKKDGETIYGENANWGKKHYTSKERASSVYEPPLPVSVLKEEIDEKYKNKGGLYSKVSRNGLVKNEPHYDPPLPVSVVKEDIKNEPTNTYEGCYGKLPQTEKSKDAHSTQYEPPLPTSALEIKSTRGKHSTEKPVELIKWILKYYSKPGDVVLDPTCGSGSTGVACKDMNRKFIGIEMDEKIYQDAYNRLF